MTQSERSGTFSASVDVGLVLQDGRVPAVALNPQYALAAVQQIARRSGRHGEAVRDRCGMIETSGEQNPREHPENG